MIAPLLALVLGTSAAQVDATPAMATTAHTDVEAPIIEDLAAAASSPDA